MISATAYSYPRGSITDHLLLLELSVVKGSMKLDIDVLISMK
jgi:hypothetical protein